MAEEAEKGFMVVDLTTLINNYGTEEASIRLGKMFEEEAKKREKASYADGYANGKYTEEAENKFTYGLYALAVAIVLSVLIWYSYLRLSKGHQMFAEEIEGCKAGDVALCLRTFARTGLMDDDRNLAYNTYLDKTGKPLPGVGYRNNHLTWLEDEKR